MDREQRDDFESALAAPMDGIGAPESDFLAALDEAALREAEQSTVEG